MAPRKCFHYLVDKRERNLTGNQIASVRVKIILYGESYMRCKKIIWSWKTGFWGLGLIWIHLVCIGVATAQDFVVLGNEGVWLRKGSTVLSGDVGANQAGNGTYLNGEQEVTIGHNVVIQDPESRVMGDSIRLKSDSKVQSIAVNTLSGSGQIRGTVTTPVTLPLVSVLPPIPHVKPGFHDIQVPENGTRLLEPGHYDRLKVGRGATLVLAGGRYHFRQWDVREGARVLALNPVKILVKGRIEVGQHTVVGPASRSAALTAGDVVIICTAPNARMDESDDTWEAVSVGKESVVRANVYVPYGLLRVGGGSHAKGAFVGKWVRMGDHSVIELEGGFGLGQGGNAPPVAQAGLDQTVQVGTIVRLDGGDSADVDGNRLTYRWELLSRPSGSVAALSDVTAIMPTLMIDVPGTYTLQLIVNDGRIDSEPDTVLITTINSPPVGVAGQDQTVFVTQSVFLDGTQSRDVDGDALSFNWAFLGVPSGSMASLLEPTSPTPSFQVDKPGAYHVQLIVNDGHEDSVPVSVFINTQNSKPVAYAGQDQILPVGNTVQLDGRQSSDVDGDPLTFQWTLIAMPTGSTAILSDSTGVRPSFVAEVAGVYVAQLIVNDGKTNSLPVTVTMTAGNTAPIADAGQDQHVQVHTLVTLNGSASRDLDGNDLTFQWLLQVRPPESAAFLLNPGLVHPTLVPDVPGTYVASLVVSDGLVISASDSVAITALASPSASVPSLIIASPAEGSVVGMSPITVTGFVSDTAATVTVNGISATLTGNVFVADGIILQEGQNTLVVTGVDASGHTNTISRTVTRSATPTYLTPIWGPVEWVKQTGGEEIFQAKFSNCEPAAQYELVIINGVSGGANRVTQGTVLLNGVEVISRQELTSVQGQVTIPVTIQAMNDLEVRASGPIGAQVQAYIACTANCLSVTIDLPLDGATINQPTLLVKGRTMSSSPRPVGVLINRQAAKVFGSAFAVDRVPIREGSGTLGPTTIVAEATNACGQRASSTIQVHTTAVATNQVQLRVSPDRNVAPSQVASRVFIDLDRPVSLIQWDHQGDGTIDAQGSDLFEQTVIFTEPGLYQPKVIVTDDAGNTFERSAVVLVEDSVVLEARLNADWTDLMGALAQGNIEEALTYIHSQKREVMRHDWMVLKDHVGELAATFGVPLHLTDGQGVRIVARSSTPLIIGTIQFPLEVEFVLDDDGQWRIRNY